MDSVGCLFQWGIVYGVREAICMRGGACAAELHLMGVCFCWGGLCG